MQEINALALPAFSSASTLSAFSLVISSSGSDASESSSSTASPSLLDSPTRSKAARSRARKRTASVHGGVPLPESGTLLDCFTKGALIGNGVSSNVYSGLELATKRLVAIKEVHKSLLMKNEVIAHEVQILKDLQHPNVVGLIDVYFTDSYLQIVMELVKGTELFDVICHRKSFSEKDAKNVTQQIISGVSYLHSRGIVHRDLKPENIMCHEEPNGLLQIKIIDFGFAKKVQQSEEKLSLSNVGTLGYKAPEIFNDQQYTPKADMWSVGIITYIMLCGFPPFVSHKDDVNVNTLMNTPFWYLINEKTEEYVKAVTSGDYSFPTHFWKHISMEARDLIKKMLVVDVNDRWSSVEALEHAWFAESDEKSKNSIDVTILRQYISICSELKERFDPIRPTLGDSSDNFNYGDIDESGRYDEDGEFESLPFHIVNTNESSSTNTNNTNDNSSAG